MGFLPHIDTEGMEVPPAPKFNFEVIPNTKVRKGDRFESCYGNTIILYGKNNEGIINAYQSDKYEWIVLRCKLYEYARLSKSVPLMQLFVDLLERNRPGFLCCESLIRLTKKERIPVPSRWHCSSCSRRVLRGEFKGFGSK